MQVALYQPEIPWNTGNVGRTCVAVGAALHLIEPLGFTLSERRLKRAGLDYWPRLDLRRHADFGAFAASLPAGARVVAFSAAAETSFWDLPFRAEDVFLFGRESTGLPPDVLGRCGAVCRIPILEGERSLNLSTAVAVALFEARRRRNESVTSGGQTAAMEPRASRPGGRP